MALASLQTGLGWMIPPVDDALVRHFEAAEHDYGPGHRGIDFAAQRGARVRAAAAGKIAFAGRVAGHGAVTIDHGHDVRTTYSRLAEVYVSVGDEVEQGTWLGTAGDAHHGVPGLHFGVIVAGEYADPETYLGPLDAGTAIHLAPAAWTPPEVLPGAFASAFEHAGTHVRGCEPIAGFPPRLPPNDNVVVAIAGIGSRTFPNVEGEIFEHGPEQLGYAPEDVYPFSYRGDDGADLHEDYPASATGKDIRSAAGKLRDLLVQIARRHPDRGIDLIAHSQGGIVAHTYLKEAAASWDPATPRVEHAVTFASPHEGAPLAAVATDLTRKPGFLGAIARGVGYLAAARRGLPHPGAGSVGQLAPGSDLLDGLAREDVLFGVRALALTTPNDLIVPASHARWRGETSATVPPAGGLLGGHEAIVSSEAALAIAHRFLRDGPPLCPTKWDDWGSLAGRTISATEGLIPDVLDAVVP